MEAEHAARLQLEDIVKDCLRRIDILLKEIAGKHVLPDAAREAGAAHQGLELRGKDKIPVLCPVIERLLADAVAHQQQLLTSVVVQRNGEHAVQPAHTFRSPLQIRSQNDFRIAAAAEGIVRQLLLQLQEVVDFSVEDNRNQPVRCRHGLVSQRR